jgi:prepilin-type N-terminal cleavage/methylation domain-containing protein
VRKPPRYLGESGVTLLELLIALVLLGVVTAGVYAMVVSSANAARSTNAFLLTQAQVRAALDNIVDEARWAEAVNAAGPTCVTLKVPSNTPFSGQSPPPSPGPSPSPGTSYSVRFEYDPVQRAVVRQQSSNADAVGCPLDDSPWEPVEILAYSVVHPGGPGNPCGGTVGLCFEYFDAAGNSLGPSPGSPADIARIRVVVSTTRDGATRTFAGDVALRARP